MDAGKNLQKTMEMVANTMIIMYNKQNIPKRGNEVLDMDRQMSIKENRLPGKSAHFQTAFGCL